jgi:hypothetical protein
MVLVYRALGIAAAVNSALSRYRVNFVPGNFILGGVAVCVFVFNAGGWLEAVENGTEARTIPLGQLTPERIGRVHFVKTSGTLVPEAGFQYGEQDESGNIKKVKMEFVPIVDRESGRGMFVQLPASHRFGQEPQDLEISGMVRPMQEVLARELRGTNFEYGGVQMLPDYILVADETPGEASSWQLGAALSGGVVLVFGLLLLKRNTIFVAGAAEADASEGGVDLTTVGVTGTFLLETHKQRFLNVPAAINTLDNGDAAFFSNIDASSNFMGVRYSERAGIWMLPIAAGSIQNVQQGVLYYGTKAMPAVRFDYRETGSNASRNAVVTTASATASRLLLDELSSSRDPAPQPVAAPIDQPRPASAPSASWPAMAPPPR